MTLEWDQVESHKDVPITGYMVRVDDQQLGEVLSRNTRKTTIDNLQPGKWRNVLRIVQLHHFGERQAKSTARYPSVKSRATVRLELTTF